MNAKQTHTQGPWTVFGHHESDYVEILGEYEGIVARATHGDAERIVACVNACEGVDTDALTEEVRRVGGFAGVLSVLENVKTERDTLRAENERLREALQKVANLDAEPMMASAVIQLARAALAGGKQC